MNTYRWLFRQPGFPGLYIGQLISRLGDGIAYIVTTWSVWKITGSPLLLALSLVTQTIAQLVFGFIGGQAADRYIHRKMMMYSDVVRLIVTFIMCLLCWGGLVHSWFLILFAFLINAAGCFFGPARSATVAAMLPAERLQTANGLMAGSFQGAMLMGQFLGGYLMSVTHLGTLFLVDALTFAVSLIGLLTLPETKSATVQKRRSLYANAREGFATVKKSRALFWAVGTFWLGTFFAGGVGDAGRTMLMNKIGSDATGLGMVSAFMGVGILLGSLWVAHVKTSHRVRLIIGAWVVEGLLTILMGVSPNLVFALSVSFLCGVATSYINVLTESLIQLHGKGNVGKVFSYWTMSIWLGQLLSLGTIVPLFKWMSISTVFGLAGGVLVILALMGLLSTWKLHDEAITVQQNDVGVGV